MPYTIAPSLLSANWARLGEEAQAVLAAGGDILHLDVMDNHYVPNLTVGPLACEALRKFGIKAPIDVHLMTSPVDNLIHSFAKAGATALTIHPEATQHLDRSLQIIRKEGCQSGVAINPATSLDCLSYVLDKIDLILIMSVNPGFGGQSFIPTSLDKIRQARELIAASGFPIRLAVDGGIKASNILSVAEAGADTFILGSGIFHEPDYRKIMQELRHTLSKANKA